MEEAVFEREEFEDVEFDLDKIFLDENSAIEEAAKKGCIVAFY